MNQKIAVLLLLFLCVGFSNAIAVKYSPESLGDIASLTGHKNLYVMVEKMDRVEKLSSLKRDDIQTQAETRLKSAGINIVANNPKIPGHLYLSVNAAQLRYRAGCFFNASLEFRQIAILEASDYKTHGVGTWERAILSKVPCNGLAQQIREVYNELLDLFINDYFKANPKSRD